jgi:hypothetical protein
MSISPPLPPPPAGAEPEPLPEAPPAPPQGSPAKVVVAATALFLVLGLAALGGAWLLQPGACADSTVESARFGYCLAAPGWEYTNEQTSSDLPYDELVHPVDSSSVRIVAVETPNGLNQVISDVRESETGQEGIVLGEIVDTTVGGVPARRWDISLEADGVELQIREVVFVRGGTAWKVQLIAEREGFDTRVPEFEQILRSWNFK